MARQSQVAGPDSTQIQAQTVYNVGIDEKRVREIFNEQFEIAIRSYAEAGRSLGRERIGRFESQFIEGIKTVGGIEQSLGDPSYLFDLNSAQKSAAKTDQNSDYELLTNLLIQRHQEKDDRQKCLGISRAIEAVGSISEEALRGLTAIYVASNIYPISGDPNEGLRVMNETFERVVDGELPTTNAWMDHLDLLDAVRISSIGTMKSLVDTWEHSMEGYFDVGVPDGERYAHVLNLLKEAELPEELIQPNPFLSGHNKLCITSFSQLEDGILHFQRPNGEREKLELNTDQIRTIKKARSQYATDKSLKEAVKNEFVARMHAFASIALIDDWMAREKHGIRLTPLGRVLAHANAASYDDSFPEFDSM